MSATNRTENYNLPIFIETDKPAWLVDFNGAMRSIDAQMKLNAEAIATKSPILTFQDTADIDFTKTGDIVTANLQSAITDKVGRALVTPLTAPSAEQLVAIDSNGNQAAVEIGSGIFNDNGTLKAIDLNLTDIETYTTASEITGGVTLTNVSITKALNADGSIGKIYGQAGINGGTSGVQTFFTGITVAPTGSEYLISFAGLAKGNDNQISAASFRIDATGKVYCRYYRPNTQYTQVYWWPCLYFFKNFGDIT